MNFHKGQRSVLFINRKELYDIHDLFLTFSDPAENLTGGRKVGAGYGRPIELLEIQ